MPRRTPSRSKPPRVRVHRGGRRNDYRIERLDESEAPVGPDVVIPRVEDVLAAIAAAPPLDDWSAVRDQVIPVFPRVRPQPAGYPVPLRTLLPPGVVVQFGIDIGPAFMSVSPGLLDSLGVSEGELVAESLANLLRRAEEIERGSIVHQEVAGWPVAALQSGLSVASTLVLVPDQLVRLFGRASRLFIAPMRDLLLGLPPDVPPEVAHELFHEFASQDPNALAPMAYAFDGDRVSLGFPGTPAPAARRLLA